MWELAVPYRMNLLRSIVYRCIHRQIPRSGQNVSDGTVSGFLGDQRSAGAQLATPIHTEIHNSLNCGGLLWKNGRFCRDGDAKMAKDKKSRSNHREVEVLDALRQLGGAARNANLADVLGVSEETIRRTTKALAKADLVRRVHGGSYLADAEAGAGVFSRLGLRSGEKSRIAEAAAAMIPEGACIFLDVGSTSTFVAQSLGGRANLTVVTNSLNVAQSLGNSEGCRVFLAGGELRRTEWGAFGVDTVRYLENFQFDVAILSVDAIDADGGFLLAGQEEATVSRAVVDRTRRVIVVADHQKFNKRAPMVLCAPQSVDVVVTDQPVSAAFAQRFKDWGVELVNVTFPDCVATEKVTA